MAMLGYFNAPVDVSSRRCVPQIKDTPQEQGNTQRMREKSSTLCLEKSWWTGDWSNIQTATCGVLGSPGDMKLPIRPWDLPILPTQGEALGLSSYTAVQHRLAIHHKDHATHWSTQPTATGLHVPKQKQVPSLYKPLQVLPHPNICFRVLTEYWLQNTMGTFST